MNKPGALDDSDKPEQYQKFGKGTGAEKNYDGTTKKPPLVWEHNIQSPPEESAFVSKPTLLDELLSKKKTKAQAAEAIMDEAYGPLKQFCSLPDYFATKELDFEFRDIDLTSLETLDELIAIPSPRIINPKDPQKEAIELLKRFIAGDETVCRNGDPFQPLFGVNFHGEPGCGKTHLLAAFAALMKKFLDGKLVHYRKMIEDFVAKEYEKYVTSNVGIANQDSRRSRYHLDETDDVGSALKKQTMTEVKAPLVVFEEQLAKLKEGLKKMQYQPADLLYLDFEQLWELCREEGPKREEALAAIIRAKVLFLDDADPKGEIERTEILLRVIEGRYRSGRMGTFTTTNLGNKDLADRRSKPFESRANEMIYTIDFVDCIDWRTQVLRHRIETVRRDILQKIATQVPPGQAHT